MSKSEQNREGANKSIEDFADFVDVLTKRQETLSKRLRQVAHYFLNNPEDVAIYNIVDLAKLADVPTATVTRFAQEMGFSRFSEMQAVFRQRLVGPRMTYADRIKALGSAVEMGDKTEFDLEQPGVIFDTFVQTAIDSLLRLREDVEHPDLEKFVTTLAECRAIHIVAARGAFGVGAYTYYGLSKIGKPTHLIDNLGAMRTEQLNSVDVDDVVLVLTFDDYTPETVSIAEAAAKQGRTVLAITDNQLSPVVPIAEQSLFVKEARLGHFRSQVPALVLCQTLIVSLSRRIERRMAV